MTYLLISNLVVCGACAWCVRGVAAHVSSAVPLQRSRNGEPLMVVTLRWKSNHFLGQQSHPHPCFPPARISFSRWEDLHPKYYPPPPLIYFISFFLFSFRHTSAICVSFRPCRSPVPPPPHIPWMLYGFLLQLSERVTILLWGDYDRVFYPQITRAIKICK